MSRKPVTHCTRTSRLLDITCCSSVFPKLPHDPVEVWSEQQGENEEKSLIIVNVLFVSKLILNQERIILQWNQLFSLVLLKKQAPATITTVKDSCVKHLTRHNDKRFHSQTRNTDFHLPNIYALSKPPPSHSHFPCSVLGIFFPLTNYEPSVWSAETDVRDASCVMLN